MLKAWPKIFTLGDPTITDITKEDVEVTEKIDGSQFNFGRIEGKLLMRSKGAVINIDNPPKLFWPVVNYVKSIEDRIPEAHTFHGETLSKPKHNTLKYGRVPDNHLALYGVMLKGQPLNWHGIAQWASVLEVGCVPLLWEGKLESFDQLRELMVESSLGGAEMEGVVVKNYRRPVEVYGREAPLMQGKYVSEKFKETHRKNPEFITKGDFVEGLIKEYTTEARWQKAIQRMDERGELTRTPKDIGPLLGEITKDVKDEEGEAIKERLFKHFWKHVSKGVIRGFPQWYKEQLAQEGISDV